MLAVSPLRGSQYGDVGRDGSGADAFSNMLDDFSGSFLEDIDFDDICAEFDVDGDALPDLEVDPADIFAQFGVAEEEEEEEDAGVSASAAGTAPAAPEEAPGVDGVGGAVDRVAPEDDKDPGDETLLPTTNREHSIGAASSEAASSSSGSGGGGKPAAAAARVKNSQGKKKAKVDWTPELHRRFVQAVEVLGVDKAVPSRILELMGIDCLTRHNIASHLQKYRSHRKHALAREAEAAASCWSQRRPQTYAAPKRDAHGAAAAAPWLAAPPTIGFPPPALPAAPRPVQHFRPLHVWGHPTGDLQPNPVRPWARHGLLAGPQGPPAASAPPPWAPPHHPPGPPPPEAAPYWHQYHYQRGAREGWIPHAMTQGTPCFHHPMTTARFATAPLPVPSPAAGILPHPLYRPVLRPTAAMPKQASSQLQLDAHPTKESIDAAIEDALRRPWLPMPLGLRPPSVDSVLVELQRQGVAKVPPSCTTS